MPSIAAVASARTTSATHRDRSRRTTAAQTATALVTARSAILIASPVAPEKTAIARATRPGRNGSGVAVAVAVLNGLLGGVADGGREAAPKGRPLSGSAD